MAAARFAGKVRHGAILFFSLLIWFGFGGVARAALQFDVFLGYDGIVREASWFPVICEVRNDGPSFNAYFEVSSGQFNQSQVRRVPLELPTNTRKRVVVPVFSSSRYTTWNFRLIDDKGRVRGEQLDIRPRKQTTPEIPMIAALPRSIGGVPVLPPIQSSQQELQPTPARLQVELFPDNPITLEGLNVLYLNSEAALALKVPQRDAILAWVNGGGHLVVAVEQLSDINASPWLSQVLPCELNATKTVRPAAELHSWLQEGAIKLLDPAATNSPSKSSKKQARDKAAFKPDPFSELTPDDVFSGSEMLVFTGKIRDGKILAAVQDTPLIIEASRGRGRVTLLTFSVEREPFVSWKNRAWFWAKLSEIPIRLYQTSDYNLYGGYSIDGVFGAMIDSKQVRKLPLAWLLALLVCYLLVIGPLDQYWLKKINRQMLTWVTFPAYVIIFSLLIYFIGFQLRAGDSEFNELHVVDILPRNDQSVLRGRTYASIYSPSNKKYALAGAQPFATLRGEFLYSYGAANDSSRATIIQNGNTFLAEVSVPVWTSQLYVSDWLEPAALPLKFSAKFPGKNWEVSVENHLDRKVTEARVVLDNRVYFLGDLPGKLTKKFQLETNQSVSLKDFVHQHGGMFFNAVQSRRHTFGNAPAKFDLPLGTMAASFISHLGEGEGQYFISPGGMDLSTLAEQGKVMLLAWDSGESPTKPFNQFTPRRGRQDTLFRLVLSNDPSSEP